MNEQFFPQAALLAFFTVASLAASWAISANTRQEDLMVGAVLASTSTPCLASQDVGRVSHDASGAAIRRNGDVICFTWLHRSENRGFPIELTFSLRFKRGIERMKVAYAQLTHLDNYNLYDKFIWNDPFRSDLAVTASTLRRIAGEKRLNEIEVALSFVQSLPYQVMGTYQRYAVETLIDGRGDCSETTVMLAGILTSLGHECAYLVYPGSPGQPGHILLGVALNGRAPGSYFERSGKRYFVCETTGANFAVGEMPKGYDRPCLVRPVQRSPRAPQTTSPRVGRGSRASTANHLTQKSPS